MYIFSDLGFGYAKFLSDSNRIIFPSIAGELQSSAFDLLASSNGIGITTIDGSWLFGESAIEQSAMSARWQSNDWILSPQYKAGTLAAITELSKASRLDVELSIALPYQDFVSYRVPLCDGLAGVHSVQRLGRDKQQITITFPNRFPILPQNIAPAFRHLLDKTGNFEWPETMRQIIYIGVLNIGSHTVELGTAKMQMPNNFSGIEAQSRTKADGMYSLNRSIRPLLEAEFSDQKNEFDDHEIFDIVRTGQVHIFHNDIDISYIIDAPKKQYCQRIQALCTNNWSDEAPIPKSNLFAFVVSGGGAHIVAPYLQETGYHPNLVVSDEPQWDVVSGMQRLRKMLDRMGE